MIPAPETGMPHLARTRAERAAGAVVPAGGAVWTATEIMHMTGLVPAHDIVIGTVVLTAVSWGAAAKNGRIPASVPWWLAVAGGWVTAADILGPLAWWPAPMLTAAWITYTLAASRYASQHESVTSARRRRAERIDWLDRRHAWGLGGSHLLDFQETRLGELYEVSTKGTGKRASHFTGHVLEEVIAEAEDLAVNRVRVMGHRLAGRIRISIRRLDPWADPILHPLVCDEHEIKLPSVRSIMDPAVIGQDPETGEPLTVPLYIREFGANRVSVVANTGGGKGVFEDNLFEHVTACDDALAVHLNVSVKGYEDEESWGPACWLTAYGPEQKSRAAAVLKVVAAVIEWRTKNFKRGEYAPSPEHPAIIIFYDESDAGLSALREDLNTMATKGRSHGVGLARLAQRNTREYADPKARSQDNVRCTGLVQNANEARHAGSGTGPDMSTYGEGRPGVWKVEILGGAMSLGRTWIFHRTAAGHGAEVERIAKERADYQPELSQACLEYLGDAYQVLRATEVYERYDRSRNPDAYDDSEPDPADSPAGEAPQAPAPLAPQDPAAAPSAPAPAAKTALAEQDHLERLWEMDVDETTKAVLAGIHRKLAGARQILSEAADRAPGPGVPPEVRAACIAERWRQVGEAARIPEESRPRLMELLAKGTTMSEVAAEFSLSKGQARAWLQNVRNAGACYVDGEKRGRKWRLNPAPPPESGDAQ